jgi:hypothetical protein
MPSWHAGRSGAKVRETAPRARLRSTVMHAIIQPRTGGRLSPKSEVLRPSRKECHQWS